MNSKDSQEIYRIYEAYSQETLGLNGLVMVLYFIFKGDTLTMDSRLLDMVRDLVARDERLDADMLVSLMYGISQIGSKSVNVNHALTGPTETADSLREYLKTQITSNCDSMNSNNCLVLAVGINSLYSGGD